METSLNEQIIELENELKQTKHELDRVTGERDRMLQENNDMGKDKEDRNMECKKLRTELREIKFRETRLITDYSELEEENIALQKQVSALRSGQVEFEGLKHENRRLMEDMDILKSEVVEMMNLKQITEKHMEEALESLQSEREAKKALKKELDQYMKRQSFYKISNLAYSIRGMADEQGLGSEDDDLPGLKMYEANINADDSGHDLSSPDGMWFINIDSNTNIFMFSLILGNQVDLFSEVHLNELKKLEMQLDQVEKEKAALTQNLRDNQAIVEKSHGELQTFLSRLSLLSAHVDSLQHLTQKVDKNVAPVDNNLSAVINQYHQWFKLSVKEVEQLRHDLKEFEKLSTISDSTIQLRNEVTNLKNKLLDNEQRGMDLENDLKLLKQFASEAGSSIDGTQNHLQTVTEELAQLYHHVCTVNGETPNRVVLDHEKLLTPSKIIQVFIHL